MEFEPASRRRLALAAYLDYLLFGIPWVLALWIGERSLPALANLPSATKVVAFVVFEFVLLRQARWSPGSWLLSIRMVVPTSLDAASQPTLAGRVFVVPASLKRHERWWTVLLGVLCVLDGSKAMVRWTMFVPPTAIFGQRIPDEIVPAVLILVGAAELALAAGVLRLRLYPILAGALYYLLFAASFVASWSVMPALVEEYAHLRRASQGLAVRPGEVELLQSFVPFLFVAVPALLVGWFLLAAYRARRARAELTP